MKIEKDSLDKQDIIDLLQDHLNSMFHQSPPESVHALDLLSLKRPEITFLTAREGGALLGCGALKELDPRHGELKSMKTSSAHLRKGVAKSIVLFLIDEAKRRGYTRLSLETGSFDSFLPARNLYLSCGFDFCGPFGDYSDDPNSVFMTMEL
jgi:putative acetyltransferase